MAYRVAVADDSGGWARVDRLERYAAVAESLALLSDRRLRDLLDGSAVVGTGIGGTTSVVHVDGTPVFVKQVPLTDLERRPEHVMSTANLFDLPLGCQYGVGSPSFGVWRELAALVTTSSWVLAGRTAAFPLLYHWRVLDDCHLALSDELADVETAVARLGRFVGGAPAHRGDRRGDGRRHRLPRVRPLRARGLDGGARRGRRAGS